ncbi:PTPN4 [Mytilus coruscus]|uniref:PTPN4 n=1 Tax=Mytilus coruscus TaxID=42192 RepID=A0A6J8BVD9_MYTCO|nr:PTPN4 [Mytilus coruscus]
MLTEANIDIEPGVNGEENDEPDNEPGVHGEESDEPGMSYIEGGLYSNVNNEPGVNGEENDGLELQAMSLRLMSGGTYDVRASEMAANFQDIRPKTVTCVVHFLDDSQEVFEVDKRAKAQHLLDKVFGHLELVEKDYFGLQFIDIAPPTEGAPHGHVQVTSYAMRWLDPLKTIKKQCRGPPFEFFFRVKFYVSDPSKLAEEYTRYHFFLQVKRDILEGRLMCPQNTAILLASYAVQSELGDFNPDEHRDNYLADYRFIPNQTPEFEKQVSDLHKQHRGQNPADAEYNYLDKAKRLEMYGVDLHNARSMMIGDVETGQFNVDQSSVDIQLGVTSVGLVVFQNNVKINTFPWAKIVKISFKRKQFFIQLRREVNDSVENLIGFNMNSYRSCKNLWKSCVEHHTFFRLYVPNPPSKKVFSLGSKFRYRSSSSKGFARRTVGGHTRNTIMEERNFIDGYRNIPKSQTFSGTNNSAMTVNHSIKRYDGVNNQTRATLPHDYKVGSSSRASIHSEKSDDDGGFLSHNATKDTYPQPIPTKKVIFPANGSATKDVPNHTENDLPTYNDYVPNREIVGCKHVDLYNHINFMMNKMDVKPQIIQGKKATGKQAITVKLQGIKLSRKSHRETSYHRKVTGKQVMPEKTQRIKLSQKSHRETSHHRKTTENQSITEKSQNQAITAKSQGNKLSQKIHRETSYYRKPQGIKLSQKSHRETIHPRKATGKQVIPEKPQGIKSSQKCHRESCYHRKVTGKPAITESHRESSITENLQKASYYRKATVKQVIPEKPQGNKSSQKSHRETSHRRKATGNHVITILPKKVKLSQKIYREISYHNEVSCSSAVTMMPKEVKLLQLSHREATMNQATCITII